MTVQSPLPRRPRLVSLTTAPISALLLQEGQLSFLREHDVEVFAVSSPGKELRELSEREGVEVIAVPMTREIHPVKDLVSLFRLWCVLRRLRPDIVNAGTPKAGLLGMMAAWLARVPVRIYTQRGLRLETCRGWKLRLLTWTEQLACLCATQVVFVSHSLRSKCLERGLVHADKAVVIGVGSSNGVNVERFVSQRNSSEVEELSRSLGLNDTMPVIGFVGRLTKDKGIRELCQAFGEIRKQLPAARLLIVGQFEVGDPVDPETVSRLQTDDNVIITGFVKEAAPYYHLMTVLAFPSHREGFPNVPLEAACAGRAAVGFEVTGTVDAIQDGVTGTIVPVGDTSRLAAALGAYLTDPALRLRHGTAAHERVLRDFAPAQLWAGLLDLYRERLRAKGNSVGAASRKTKASWKTGFLKN